MGVCACACHQDLLQDVDLQEEAALWAQQDVNSYVDEDLLLPTRARISGPHMNACKLGRSVSLSCESTPSRCDFFERHGPSTRRTWSGELSRSSCYPADEDASPSSPASDASTAAPSRPNFSGSWLCVRTEGDWESFLREQGMGWATRKTIAGLNYGVGHQIQEVVHSGDVIEIANFIDKYPAKESRATYKIDGAPERTVDLEGRPCISVSAWDGDGALLTKQMTVQTSQALPDIRRYMLGEEMCTERVSPAGLVVRRFYQHRP